MSQSILITRDGWTADPSTLTAEHALLLAEVTSRANDLSEETDQGRWPYAELERLLDYLHLEVLRQIVDEEWLLFRHFHHDRESLTQLRQEHCDLRALVDLLNEAPSAPNQSPRRLSDMVRVLVASLRSHFEYESRILGVGVDAPSTNMLGQRPHTWYSLLEGPVVDLDLLVGPNGIDAALARILRLRVKELVEVRSSSDLTPLRRRLSRADPGAYGFTLIERGPPRWRLEIVRRAAN